MLLLFESERSTTYYLPSRTGFIRAPRPTQKTKTKIQLIVYSTTTRGFTSMMFVVFYYYFVLFSSYTYEYNTVSWW